MEADQVLGGHPEEAGGDDEAMLWSIQEALERQTLQIGASACGATAVVDVLKALGVDVPPEEADRCVQTRLRRNESPLPDYLLSRSEAGATHAQLIRGAEEAGDGKVAGRFFHLHPRRRVRLVAWLAGWIRRGAVPVATMNMQLAVPEGEEVPDAWHHQLVFGVAANAVFMTNPLDVVSEAEMHQRLCSESVLLVRREDVLQRLTPDCSLSDVSGGQSDPRWEALDVEGQVRKMVLEEEQESDQPKTTHITIPAAYSSGVTLFALRQSELGQELLAAPELPLL
ncbi:uncharacterized protein LOC103374622 [Stegastes partitus]|uniref:Uncharacterized protein LOC103374622 n=1 Tax=Stegastes partitus TaxID=144197 RepID=A0A9Y4NTB4_9TELE|nr:PREDICTED: uncharacterized protein LOC103374622 [Stegastes partitus]XP_008302961.1 PREDICTED: uncharacterized protein LOC103374622 [Stegastes partitus]